MKIPAWVPWAILGCLALAVLLPLLIVAQYGVAAGFLAIVAVFAAQTSARLSDQYYKRRRG